MTVGDIISCVRGHSDLRSRRCPAGVAGKSTCKNYSSKTPVLCSRPEAHIRNVSNADIVSGRTWGPLVTCHHTVDTVGPRGFVPLMHGRPLPFSHGPVHGHSGSVTDGDVCHLQAGTHGGSAVSTASARF